MITRYTIGQCKTEKYKKGDLLYVDDVVTLLNNCLEDDSETTAMIEDIIEFLED